MSVDIHRNVLYYMPARPSSPAGSWLHAGMSVDIHHDLFVLYDLFI